MFFAKVHDTETTIIEYCELNYPDSYKGVYIDIILVYNVEKYLCKCIDAVIAQTYDNFETMLVVDDFTDNIGKVCNEYAEKDNCLSQTLKFNVFGEKDSETIFLVL